MTKQNQVVNGFIIDRKREYTLAETAPFLGVTMEMMKKYVHEYGFLIARHLTRRTSVISGEQIIYFHQHKAEMMLKRRVLLKERRQELKQHRQIAEDWMQEAPIDPSWAEKQMAGIAAARDKDRSMKAQQDELLQDDANNNDDEDDPDNFYRDFE